MDSLVDYRWRAEISDRQLTELTASHGGRAEAGWWDRIRPHSLGWVSAHQTDGTLVGFVNVAWDGADHAFLLDTKVRTDCQRRGIARELVRRAALEAKGRGCEWLHVDFEVALSPFYLEACGFQPTAAGLIHLSDTAEAS
jgi:ribosomal protein S18 acetylase RimI-like enzyme